jgi:5-methylcytosine-specific restriction endonuclease McrA
MGVFVWSSMFDFITADNVHKAILALEYFTDIWRIESTEGRLNDDDWQIVRRIVLKRDRRTCCNCTARGTRLDVHHIVPIGQGGSNRLTNLAVLCFECHKLIHPWMKP